MKSSKLFGVWKKIDISVMDFIQYNCNNMAEQSQNQYFQEYARYGMDSNPSFAMILSLEEQMSLFKGLHQPFLQQQFQNFQEGCPQKNSNKNTQIETKPTFRIRSQTTGETQATQQQIIFETETLSNHKTVFRGTKDDTVELNTNFKTILANYLKELSITNQLNQFQLLQFQEFAKRVPSFKSLKQLFSRKSQNQRLRNVCLQFVESGKCMRRILSSRCGLRTKLQMVKYVQKLGLNIKRKEIVKWKDEVKRPFY